MTVRCLLMECFLLSNSCSFGQEYTPPSESGTSVDGVPFDKALPAAKLLKAAFDSCDLAACKLDPSRNKALLKFPSGAVFYESKMAIDIDGSALAAKKYRDAVANHERVIDQPDTSLRYADGTSLDADKILYIAVPGGNFRNELHVNLGDVVAVIYRASITYAVVGDVGPKAKIGEGSLELHEKLGHDACRSRDDHGKCQEGSNSSIGSEVLFFIFPNSGKKLMSLKSPTQLQDGVMPANLNAKVEELGRSLFQSLKDSATVNGKRLGR